jgi:hypothetical protein
VTGVGVGVVTVVGVGVGVPPPMLPLSTYVTSERAGIVALNEPLLTDVLA